MNVSVERSLIVKDCEGRNLLDVLIPGDWVEIINTRGSIIEGEILQIYSRHICIATDSKGEYNVSLKRIDYITRKKHG